MKQRMMEVVSGDNWTSGAISRANHHHQQSNTQFLYRTDALPVAQPTVYRKIKEMCLQMSTKFPSVTVVVVVVVVMATVVCPSVTVVVVVVMVTVAV